MIDIFVQRYAGDIRGDDIVDPLLSELSVALARGRSKLDESALPQQPVELTVRYRPGLRLGQLIEAHDRMQGVSWRGKIAGISHRISNGQVYTVLETIRPEVSF